MLLFLFFIFLFFFCMFLIFLFYSFFKKENLFWVLFYCLLIFGSTFLFFFFQDVELFYWIIFVVSQQGKNIIVLGEGQQLLFLLIELSFFLTVILFFPLVLHLGLNFFLTVWTVQERRVKDFVFFLVIYFYVFGIWIFYQDIGFSSWEIFRLISRNENAYPLNVTLNESKRSWDVFFTVFDYQPQLETVWVVLRTEMVDLFIWEFVLLCCYLFFYCTSITPNVYFFEFKWNWKFHFLCFLFFLLGFYFFFGGDGFFLDLMFLVMCWLFFELWVFSFYFFSFLKKYKK